MLTERTSEERTFHLPRALSSLRHRNFRLFWCGQIISLTGTWMQTTGQSWLVLELTSSAWQLGIVGALQFLPFLLFGLFGGVLADRFPKRTVILCAQAFLALQAVALWLLVITGLVQLWHVYVLAFLLGVTNAVDMPARQSFVSEMVGRKDLPNAIALNSTIFNTARVIGPAIGGLLITAFGVTPLFLLNALSFVPALIGLMLINSKKLHIHPQVDGEQAGTNAPQSTLQSLREGLSYIRRMPAVLLVIVTIGTVSLFGVNFNVVLPLFTEEVLHGGADEFGFISAALGLGSLCAALRLAWFNIRPSIKHILLSTMLFGVFGALFAISRWFPLSLVLVMVVGFNMITFAALSNTLLQTVTPDQLRGRIMSVYLLVFNGSTPLGNLFIGGLSQISSPVIAQLSAALACLATSMVAWFCRGTAEESIKKSLALDQK